MRPRSGRAASSGLLACGMLVIVAIGAPRSALAKDKGAKVFRPDHADVSAPLWSMSPIPPPKTIHLREEHALPPGINQLPASTGLTLSIQGSAESVVQDFLGPLAMPVLTTNFEGVGQGFVGPAGTFTVSSAPPDTEGDVGPNHYVQWNNTSFAVFDKTGTPLYGPAAGNSLWQGFGGGCQSNNDGDPIVQYDQLADRWIFTQFSVSTTPYLQCLAISTSPDPTGSYYRYSFSYTYFNDYPKLGVWPDGYYATYNMFNGNSWVGGEVCAFDRAKMLAGDPSATMQCFGPYSAYGGMLPADLDGATLPPSAGPNYVLAFGTNSLLLWKTHIDWANAANSTFTGPTGVTGVAAFTTACGGGTCVPQPGTSNQLDSLADRLMYRLAYRNFGDHEALVTNHSVTSGGVAAIRWYEIRSPGSSPAVYQQGTYQPDTNYRWMGSVAMDGGGNLAVGYSVSSSSVYPSVRYAGRLVTDPLGQLSQGESSMFVGTGSQTGTLHRWGDYSSMSVDPVDDCTFWYTQEYIATNGSFNWHTRIGSFKYPGPGAPATIGATANGNNRIDVSWSSVALASTYRILRATASGGPYTEIAAVAAPTTAYADTSVGGGVTYYYVVVAENYSGGYCGRGQSAQASATTSGACDAPPTFAGVTSVSAPSGATCGLRVQWSAATAPCGGAVAYAIYRSTSSPFTPSDSNRVAAGVAATSYTDSAGLTSGTTYYYIVHAVDQGNGVEDANTVTASGAPVGPAVDGTWSAGAEPGDPTMGMGSPWAVSTARFHSGTACYASGYANNECAALSTPSLTLTTGQSPALTYWTAWDIENRYDGGVVEISTNGGATWSRLTPNPNYPGTFRTSGDACGYASGTPCYTGTGNLTFQQYTVSLASYAGQAVLIRWRFSTDGSVTGQGWFVDDIQVTHVQLSGSCAGPPDDVQDFTVTSKTSANTLEWLNPLNAPNPYGTTQVNYRTDGTYPTGPTNGTTLVTQAGTADAHDNAPQGSLLNGSTYYYSAFVNGASNGSGPWSGPGMNTRSAPAGSIVAPLAWSFSSGATSLSSPKRGYNFSGVLEASNDRRIYAMLPGTGGGTWPTGFTPEIMNGPALQPPALLQITAGDIPSSPLTTRVAFAGSLDGNVYAIDADKGTELWRAALPGSTMIAASPMLMHTSYGGIANLVLVGTRNASVGNEFCALKMGDGSQAWCFTNAGVQGGDSLGIGIVSGPAYIDAAWSNPSYPGWKRAFFASRSWGGGSSATLWCVRFTASQVQRMWAVNPAGAGETGDIDGSPTWNRSTNELLIGTNDGRVAAVNPDTGAVNWSRSLGDGAVKEFITFDSARNRLLLSTSTKAWSIPSNGSAGDDRSIALVSPSRPLWVYNTTYIYVGARDPNNTANGLLVELDASQNWSQVGYTPKTLLIPSASWLGGVTVDIFASPWVAHVGSASGRIYTVAVPLP